MKEQTMPTESLGKSLNRAVGNFELPGDLAKAGAGHEAMEDGLEESAVAEPIAVGEGL